MTPLPRWVFLALLLASTGSLAEHSIGDACVWICHAQSHPTKIAGVCKPRSIVLQSSGDHTAIQRLSKLCLTPCIDPITTGASLTFEDSGHCHSFRKFLINLSKCSCTLDEHQRIESGVDHWKDSWLENFFKDYPKYGLNADNVEERAKMVLRRILKESDSVRTLEEYHSGAHKMIDTSERVNLADGNVDQSDSILEENQRFEDQDRTTITPISTEEPPIDWEMWCMFQCDKGQGGSACHCDLIP